MGIINEAPYKLRRSMVLLFGLWFGNRKPTSANFINHCVEELIKLSKTGVDINGVLWKIRPLIITVDTVARAVVRNTTQFNGEFGCDFCLHPG